MQEILRINLKSNDVRFEKLAKMLLGTNKSTNDLIDFFGTFLDSLNVLKVFKSYINDINKLNHPIPEMFTKTRAKNSFVEITASDMRSILKNSLNKSWAR